MSMHSVAVLMIGLVVAIVVIGGLLVALRVYGARQVEGDHPTRSRR